MDLYYNQDLSLSEVGDNEKITRQAVRTILLKSKKKLYGYEEQLKFMQKETEIKYLINKLNETELDEKQTKLIEKIDNQLDY